eukprot:Gb_13629 [translate_table: standard]
MGYSLPPLLILFLAFVGLSWHASAQSCNKTLTLGSGTRKFGSCNSLSALGATLAWTYHKKNGSVDLAFRAKPAASSGWVAWGINPNGTGMIGTQALIAFKHSNGSIIVDTYDVESKVATLKPSKISLTLTNKSAEFVNGEIKIFATVSLPSKKSTVNQVWQVGSAVNGLYPKVHSFATANLQSMGSIDFKHGVVASPAPSPTPSATSPTAGGASTSPTSTSPSGNANSGSSFPKISLKSLSIFILALFFCMF